MGSNPTLSEFSFSPLEGGISFRFAQAEDLPYLIQWLKDPEVLPWFPLFGDSEIEDTAKHWIQSSLNQRGVVALNNGQPIGIATLNLQPFKKWDHHALISVIMDSQSRGKGIGTLLLKNLLRCAQEVHHMEMVYLEVYEGNPAIRLYEREGFQEIGRQPFFLKEQDGSYSTKIMMEKRFERGRT